MKIVLKVRDGKSRAALLKESFLTASLTDLLKRVAAEVGRSVTAAEALPVPVRVRR